MFDKFSSNDPQILAYGVTNIAKHDTTHSRVTSQPAKGAAICCSIRWLTSLIAGTRSDLCRPPWYQHILYKTTKVAGGGFVRNSDDFAATMLTK